MMYRALCKFGLAAALGLLGGEPPATQSAQDSHERVKVASPLASRLLRIDDADQRVREAARRDVLSITSSEFPGLREAIAVLARDRRLSPTVIRLAHDACLHIHVREAKVRFLEEQPPAQRGQAFLGITGGGEQGNPHGLSIRSTRVGFVAYEAFEEGDVLMAVRAERGLERVTSIPDLRSAIYGLSPGHLVEFLIARGGVVLRVAVRLDERPGDEFAPPSQPWELEARRVAEARSTGGRSEWGSARRDVRDDPALRCGAREGLRPQRRRPRAAGSPP